MTAKGATIAVAVIGAVATLGAAVLSNLHKSKEPSPSPSIQQTASGAGSINVGHDAVITTTSVKSQGEEAAERVQACEVAHGMKTAYEKSESVETITNSGDSKVIGHYTFRTCNWPKLRYADGDGYLEIKVQSVDGPGESDASGTNLADRITAPCPQVIATYQYGHMGGYQNLTPLTVDADNIVTVDGNSWKNENGALPFYPETGEFVVLRSDHYELENVKCP